MAECLSSKHKVLGLIPSTTKRNDWLSAVRLHLGPSKLPFVFSFPNF
jgi:hypothetical protein